jgi:hypothetical protein
MLTLKFSLKSETKTCYRFEMKTEDNQLMTLYLKKEQVKNAGITAEKGITVDIKESVNE